MANDATVLVHDERAPTGLGQIITLTPTSLRRESKGALGGGVSQEIPVQAIRGFYAVSYQRVGVLGDARGAGPAQFLFSFVNAGGSLQSETWMVDVDAPSFRAILTELAARRPDANLMSLSLAEAHKRLGKTSLVGTQAITIAVVLLVSLGGGVCLVAGLIAMVLLR